MPSLEFSPKGFHPIRAILERLLRHLKQRMRDEVLSQLATYANPGYESASYDLWVTACPTCFCKENNRLLSVQHISHSCFYIVAAELSWRKPSKEQTFNRNDRHDTEIPLLPKYLKVKQGGQDHLRSGSFLEIWRYQKGHILTLTTWS